MDGLLWRDTQLAPSKEHVLFSFLRLSWASAIFFFVWAVEVVMLVWTVQASQEAGSPTFLVSAFFLLFWTVVSLLCSAYAFGKLRAEKSSGTAVSSHALYLATGSKAVEIDYDDIRGVTLSRLPAGKMNRGLARFQLEVMTSSGASIQLPLVDRTGFLSAAEACKPLSSKLRVVKEESKEDELPQEPAGNPPAGLSPTPASPML